MAVQTIDSRYTGLAFEPEGTVAVVRGIKESGALWWKKSTPVWIVKIVRRELSNCGFYVDSDNFWRTVATFTEKIDADILCNDLRSQG